MGFIPAPPFNGTRQWTGSNRILETTLTETLTSSGIDSNGETGNLSITSPTAIYSLAQWTFMGWYKLGTGSDNGGCIASIWNGSDATAKLELLRSGTGASVVYRGGNGSTRTDIFGTASVFDATWHHVALTYDGTTLKAYVDGVLDGSGALSSSYAAGGTLTLFIRGDSQFKVSGSADELAFYNFAMSLAQVQAKYNSGAGVQGSPSDTGLVAGWHFDEATGTTAADYSASGLNWTFNGTPAWVTGKVNTSANVSTLMDVLAFADGAAANEKGILYYGDVNANTTLRGKSLNMLVNGAQVLTFGNNGEVGVNTTLPQAIVTANSKAAGIVPFMVTLNDAEVMHIDTSGNIIPGAGRTLSFTNNTGTTLAQYSNGVWNFVNQKPLFNVGLSTTIVSPVGGDTTTAIQVQTSGGTNIMNFDTTNQRVGIGNAAPNSTLHSSGSLALPTVSKTTNYTATASDYTIIASGAGTTITLPTASGITGRLYVIKRVDTTNSITVNTTSAQTIDGAATQTLGTNFATITVQSDGSNWNIISKV